MILTLESLKTAISALKASFVKPNWNENDSSKEGYIKNRPFYDTRYTEKSTETILIEFDGTLDGKESVDMNGDGSSYVVKVSDELLSEEQVIGGTGIVTGIDESWEDRVIITEDMIIQDDVSIGINANGVTVAASFFEDVSPFTKGTYFLYSASGGYYVKSFTNTLTNVIEYGELKKIDKKFLPEIGVGREGTGKNSAIFNDYSGNIASGGWSLATGIDTVASGEYSFSSGAGTTASTYGSKAFGYYTTASGHNSTADGYETIASGEGASSKGYYTIAKGSYSSAEGSHTIAASSEQHVQGRYNIEDTEGRYAHIIGNGGEKYGLLPDGSYGYIRENAHTIGWNGNGWFAGDVFVKGISEDDGEKLATENLVTTSIENSISNVETRLNEYINSSVNAIKNYTILNDIENGYEYIIQIKNGQLISFAKCISIEITQLPDKVDYSDTDIFDPTGMVVTAICQDGSKRIINNYIYPQYVTVGESFVEIKYEEAGKLYYANVNIVTRSLEQSLSDFEYTTNDDGTYTITGWKGTLNGVESTEMIIPNSPLISI